MGLGVGHAVGHELLVAVFYVLGLPEDTRESIEETVRYAKQLNTHVAQFFVFTPFPGTPVYENCEATVTVAFVLVARGAF